MQHLKLYEEFSLNKSNIYSLLGQNINNLLKDSGYKLSRSKYLSPNLLKTIQSLSNPAIVSTLNVSSIYKVLEDFYKKFIDDIKATVDKDVLKELFDLEYQFMIFFLLSFRFDFLKLKKIINKSEWFNPYVLAELKDLKESIKKFDKKYNNMYEEDVEKLKNNVLINYQPIWKTWKELFQSEKILKIRDLAKYNIKADTQQTESENKIIDFNQKASDEEFKDLETPELIEKLKKTIDFKSFDKDWLTQFDQRGLLDSHKLMKEWFLKAVQEAEKNFGKSFIINSAYRTKEYQALLAKKGYKTAKNHSPHLEGVAVDISIINLDANKIIDAFQKVGVTRFGVGKSFLHIDMGDVLNPKIWVPYARWTYTY
jgi:uncharacterized protein YcbK (DUF882 family)